MLSQVRDFLDECLRSDGKYFRRREEKSMLIQKSVSQSFISLSVVLIHMSYLLQVECWFMGMRGYLEGKEI